VRSAGNLRFRLGGHPPCIPRKTALSRLTTSSPPPSRSDPRGRSAPRRRWAPVSRATGTSLTVSARLPPPAFPTSSSTVCLLRCLQRINRLSAGLHENLTGEKRIQRRDDASHLLCSRITIKSRLSTYPYVSNYTDDIYVFSEFGIHSAYYTPRRYGTSHPFHTRALAQLRLATPSDKGTPAVRPVRKADGSHFRDGRATEERPRRLSAGNPPVSKETPHEKMVRSSHHRSAGVRRRV
jgi:hypothetical protein